MTGVRRYTEVNRDAVAMQRWLNVAPLWVQVRRQMIAGETISRKVAIKKIRKALPVPNSTDRIVLLDPANGPKDRPFKNLARRTVAGKVVWRAKLPVAGASGQSDRYVRVEWEGAALAANLWSGNRVLLDPETGEALTTTFTK
jgi:hypothetical protein